MIVNFDQTQNFIVTLTETEGAVSFESSLEMAVTFSEGGVLSCVFEPEDDFSVDFGTNIASGDYSGTYEITPTNSEQYLPTENKTLSQNVVVHKTPYAEVTNAYGGKTVTIL